MLIPARGAKTRPVNVKLRRLGPPGLMSPSTPLLCSDFGTRNIRTGLPAKNWRNLVGNTLDVLASCGHFGAESAPIFQTPSQT